MCGPRVVGRAGACAAMGLGALAALPLLMAMTARPSAAAEANAPIFIEDHAPNAEGVILLEHLRGTAERPLVVRGRGEQRTKVPHRLRLTGASHVVLERLDFAADATGGGRWAVGASGGRAPGTARLLDHRRPG